MSAAPALATDAKLAMLEGYAGLSMYLFPVWWLEADGRCGCEKDCESPGKHPVTKLVPHGKLNATSDPAIIRAWHQAYPRLNWGLALAPSFLCCVDVDPRNGGDATLEKLEAEHGPLHSDWMQRTGSGGGHYVFACPEGLALPGKLGKGIDLIRNGYILIEPSFTWAAYEWLDGGPMEGDMPSALPGWIAALATTASPALAPAIAGDAVGFEWMGDEGRAELCSALEAIPNVDRPDWVKVGMVLHMLDPNPQGLGYELWEWWSQLGDGAAKFDPKDQARVWVSFSRKKDVSLNRESIFYWAREQGWRSVQDQTIQAQVEKVIDRMDNGMPLAVQEDAAGGYGRCPVPLVEETAAWISQHGGAFYPDASLAATLALASLAASRVYQGIDGSPAHLYLGLSAQSVNEIRYALTALEEVLIESGLRRMMRVSRFGGPGAVYKTLLRAPASLYLTSELETLIRFARRQPSGTAEIVLNLLAEIHARRDLQVDGADEYGLSKLVSDDQPVIRNPCLSMLALMSGESWELLAKSSEIGRGATELLLAVQCHPDDVLEHQAAPEAAPAWLTEHVRAVRRLPPKGHELDTDLGTIFAGNAELRPDLAPVHFEAYPDESRLAAIPASRAMRPILRGAQISMRRLCVALAAWADPARPVVTPSIAHWVTAFVVYHVGRTVERLDLMANDDGKVDVAQKVMVKLVEAGKHGMTQRDLVKYCRPFKNLSKDDQAKLLEKMEIDRDIHIGSPEGRQRGKRIVAAKFVKSEADEVNA